MAVMGIDLGTSSIKVLILDNQGRTVSVSKANYAVRSPQPGWAESDPNEWWRATVAAVHAAMERAPQVEITALGLSGQMHGVVITSREGDAIRPALLWADTRAQEELALYRALPAATLQRLANPIVPGVAGPLLCWLARHEPSSYQATCWALQPKDWLRFCMTNVPAADPSDASATLLYDLQADGWADDVITDLGLRRTLLAPTLPSGARAGTLTRRAAMEFGLAEGLPVATGAADTAAAALGTGLLTPGSIQLTLGTGAQLIQLSAQPVADPTGRTHLYRAADDEHWYAMAAVQNAGLALDWVCRTLAASWDELYASIDMVEAGAEGLMFFPYLTRERPHQRNPQSTGTFLAMRIDHQRKHLLRAALEGVAFNIRAALEALPGARQIATPYSGGTAIRLAGGGSVHASWRQMLADVLKRELVTVDTADASARGAALLGGIVNGLWADTAATASVAPQTHLVVSPNSEQSIVYDEIYARYQRLSEAIATTA